MPSTIDFCRIHIFGRYALKHAGPHQETATCPSDTGYHQPPKVIVNIQRLIQRQAGTQRAQRRYDDNEYHAKMQYFITIFVYNIPQVPEPVMVLKRKTTITLENQSPIC